MNKSLEFVEIKSFLSKHRYVVKAIKEVNDEFISELSSLEDEFYIVLIGFKNNPKLPEKCVYITNSYKKTVYENLLEYMHLKADGWQKLIILNQKDGLKGLYKLASKDDIQKICNKEYALLGITKRDIELAEEDFKSAKIVSGLYLVTLSKGKLKKVAEDRALALSRGMTKYLDVCVCFRDGSPIYFEGAEEAAFCLYDEFHGLYVGNRDWIGYDMNAEAVQNFLKSFYRKKEAERTPAHTVVKKEEAEKANSQRTIRGKKRK